MSTCQEGFNASLTLNGTQIALLSEVDFKMKRTAKRWTSMGSVDADDVLLGAIEYDVTAKNGYVDNTYLNYIRGGSVLAGTIFPRGGTTPTISGSIVCTDSHLNNMKQATADPVLSDLSFIMYKVTHT
jgi:hypothetical protein